MEQNFSISRTEEADGPLRHVGPQGFEYPFDIQVPMTMERRVDYHNLDLMLTLSLVFAGERVEVKEVRIAGKKGFVATQQLTGLGLPRIIREIVVDAIPGSSRWITSSEDSGQKDLSYKRLAELYWFEHLSWGSPRGVIMAHTGWSRANTNWHLRRIAKEFPLPGPHASGYLSQTHPDDPRR